MYLFEWYFVRGLWTLNLLFFHVYHLYMHEDNLMPCNSRGIMFRACNSRSLEKLRKYWTLKFVYCIRKKALITCTLYITSKFSYFLEIMKSLPWLPACQGNRWPKFVVVVPTVWPWHPMERSIPGGKGILVVWVTEAARTKPPPCFSNSSRAIALWMWHVEVEMLRLWL